MKINWFKIKFQILKNEISSALEFGVSGRLNVILIYLKQGEICKDCNRYYGACVCEDFKTLTKNQVKIYIYIIG